MGAGLVRETASLVLGNYFRKRREFVEMVVQAGTGVGIVLFSVVYKEAVGWVIAYITGMYASTVNTPLGMRAGPTIRSSRARKIQLTFGRATSSHVWTRDANLISPARFFHGRKKPADAGKIAKTDVTTRSCEINLHSLKMQLTDRLGMDIIYSVTSKLKLHND